jgi:hypothetical protein
MQYDLIKDNEIVQTATFVAEELPVPSEKGIWLERVDTMPSYDANFFYLVEAHEVTDTQSITSRSKVYLELPEIKRNLTRQINNDTEQTILNMADVIQQRNATARAIQLSRLEAKGTITTSESEELDGYDSMFKNIRDFIDVGNTKELEVTTATTVTEIEAIVF